MTEHPFFGIQPSSTVSNPPQPNLLVIRYGTGPDGQPQLGLSIQPTPAQHQFGSLAEAEDWFLGEILQRSAQVQVHQLMGALGIVIGRVSNRIAANTRRGMATAVLINDGFAREFEQACNGVIRTFGANNTGGTVGRFTNIGTLTGMTVWASPAVPGDRVVVLYKSASAVNGNNDAAAAFVSNAHGSWLATQSNFPDYAGVIQL